MYKIEYSSVTNEEGKIIFLFHNSSDKPKLVTTSHIINFHINSSSKPITFGNKILFSR